jgi:hypothetical protein
MHRPETLISCADNSIDAPNQRLSRILVESVI